jgi:hypothetical protein
MFLSIRFGEGSLCGRFDEFAGRFTRVRRSFWVLGLRCKDAESTRHRGAYTMRLFMVVHNEPMHRSARYKAAVSGAAEDRFPHDTFDGTIFCPAVASLKSRDDGFFWCQTRLRRCR